MHVSVVRLPHAIGAYELELCGNGRDRLSRKGSVVSEQRRTRQSAGSRQVVWQEKRCCWKAFSVISKGVVNGEAADS